MTAVSSDETVLPHAGIVSLRKRTDDLTSQWHVMCVATLPALPHVAGIETIDDLIAKGVASAK
jgi:hypothetical protein